MLWSQIKWPGVDVIICKRDVSRAFQWLWIRQGDQWLFCTDLPGGDWGVEGDITVINLVLTFGWSGSRGE